MAAAPADSPRRQLCVSNEPLKRFYATHALEFYDTGIRESSASSQHFAALCRIGKSGLALALNDPEAALTEYQEALKIAPDTDTWETDLTLSRIQAQLGNLDLARQAMEKAMSLAPPVEQNYLRCMAAAFKQPGQ